MRTSRHATVIVPNDTTAVRFKSVYVGGTGDLAVLMEGDTVSTVFKAVPVGTTLNIAVVKVLATGTTATNLLGLA